MNYNFDEIVDRRKTDSIKFDFAVKRGKPDGLIPLWVADMDFRTPPCVVDALVEKSRHGIYGYSESSEEYFLTLKHWFKSRFAWRIEPDWLIKTPGVVFSIAMAVRALTMEGDAVLIQPPVYYPFGQLVTANSRKLVTNELVYEDGAYRIDFEDFENKIQEYAVKLFILCNPHNPVGRVWSPGELERMGDLCVKHGVTILADEIHADFIYPGFKHTILADLKPEFADLCVTCTAPTKTFNLAGLQISNILIKNLAIRSRIRHEINRSGYSQLNIMGLVACKAAYRHGEDWLEELKEYINVNLALVRSFINERLPGIRLVEPQGTYLVWLDCSGLGLEDDALDEFIIHRAGLWLDDGRMFGQGGSGFQRINIACPRATLQKALEQLETAIKELT